MAYGTPRGLDDVEAYYTHIRRGSPPPADLLEDLTERYRAIGGRSPLFEITQAQADGIAQRAGVPAYVGQKHQSPYIEDAVAKMAADGIEVAAGLVLAPHYSAMSVGQYRAKALAAASDHDWRGELRMIESWHLEPGYVDWLARRVATAYDALGPEARAGAVVVFTAHSLPHRIVERGDPYERQLNETAVAVARSAQVARWRTGWQSAGRTADRWLGPDILEIIEELADAGVTGIVVCPCGFVADHLEVLYDIDIDARAAADARGVELVRTDAPNDDPDFLDVLAGVVRRALS